MILPESISNEWQSWIDGLVSKGIRLGLDKLEDIAQKYHLTQFTCPVIIVAGTNGKGSCVRTLEAIYASAGYKTAVTSSPHIFELTERIRFNEKPITAAAFEAAAVIARSIAEDALTYFEFLTLLSLIAIKDYDPDVVILEVGLGGRQDAMNVVQSDVSIITNIDYDHQSFLGHTLEAIASEKAGIIHENQIACVITQESKQLSIKEQANAVSVPLVEAPITSFETHLNKVAVSAALAAIKCLQARLSVPDHCMAIAKSVQLFGRGTIIETENGSKVWFEIAHNPASCSSLAHKICYDFRPDYIIFNAYKDKDILNMIAPFKSLRCRWIVPKCPEDGRISETASLVCLLKEEGFDATAVDRPEEALKRVFSSTHASSILVFGGFVVVTELLKALNCITKRTESCTIS